MMASPRGDSRILLQNLADALERSKRRVGDRIRHRIVRPRPSAFAPHEIIFALPYHHVGPFNVTFGRDFFETRSVRKITKVSEIVLKRNDIAMLPAAVDQVILAVLIMERKLIDRLRAVLEAADQRLSQIIGVGPFENGAQP